MKTQLKWYKFIQTDRHTHITIANIIMYVCLFVTATYISNKKPRRNLCLSLPVYRTFASLVWKCMCYSRTNKWNGMQYVRGAMLSNSIPMIVWWVWLWCKVHACFMLLSFTLLHYVCILICHCSQQPVYMLYIFIFFFSSVFSCERVYIRYDDAMYVCYVFNPETRITWNRFHASWFMNVPYTHRTIQTRL